MLDKKKIAAGYAAAVMLTFSVSPSLCAFAEASAADTESAAYSDEVSDSIAADETDGAQSDAEPQPDAPESYDSAADSSEQDSSADVQTYADSDPTPADSSQTDSSSQTDPQRTDISAAVISNIPDREYTGAPIKPAVTVKLGGRTLRAGSDYTVSYRDNIEPGTAAVTVTGIGEYAGTKTVGFKIVMPSQKGVSKFSSDKHTSSSYRLKWSAADKASGYELFRYDKSAKKWKKLANVTACSYTIKGLNAGQINDYRVRAYRKIGSRTAFSSFTDYKTASLPGEVKNLRAADVTTSGYTIKWSKASGAQKYQVFIYDASKGKSLLYKTTSSTSVKITSRKAGQKNTYRVRAIVTAGGKNYCGNFTRKQFTSKPSAVSKLKFKREGKGTLTFRWSKVKNASKYQIFYSPKRNGKYKLLKEVSGKKTSVKTGLMPKGKRLYFKIRAVSMVGDHVQYGKASAPIKGIAFNKLSINKIMNSYSNSRKVTQVNSQGYKLSSSNKSKLRYALTCLGGDTGYILYDIESGSTVAYNADTYFETASTVKMPYVLYCLRQMEDGDPPMDKLLTYTPADYNGGSSWIKYQPFYTQYTIKRVIELIGDYSDNCGYYMMQDEFGYKGYNKFIKKLGAKPCLSPSVRWGYVSACDSAREWENMWDYLNNGRYAKFARQVFSTSCAANIRDQLGNRYTVHEKSGWTNRNYNETALVRAKHPYIVICLSTRTDAGRMRNVAEISEAIHNEMWKYYGK